jgi:hypothetical protein
MSVFTRVTWRNISEDAILHSHRPENYKSYTQSINFIMNIIIIIILYHYSIIPMLKL